MCIYGSLLAPQYIFTPVVVVIDALSFKWENHFNGGFCQRLFMKVNRDRLRVFSTVQSRNERLRSCSSVNNLFTAALWISLSPFKYSYKLLNDSTSLLVYSFFSIWIEWNSSNLDRSLLQLKSLRKSKPQIISMYDSNLIWTSPSSPKHRPERIRTHSISFKCKLITNW